MGQCKPYFLCNFIDNKTVKRTTQKLTLLKYFNICFNSLNSFIFTPKGHVQTALKTTQTFTPFPFVYVFKWHFCVRISVRGSWQSRAGLSAVWSRLTFSAKFTPSFFYLFIFILFFWGGGVPILICMEVNSKAHWNKLWCSSCPSTVQNGNFMQQSLGIMNYYCYIDDVWITVTY